MAHGKEYLVAMEHGVKLLVYLAKLSSGVGSQQEWR